MDNILDENDIKILNILSKNEDKNFIKNPQTTLHHLENAYVYKNSILSKNAINIKIQSNERTNTDHKPNLNDVILSAYFNKCFHPFRC